MSYVAVKGGIDAIRASRSLYRKMLAGGFFGDEAPHPTQLLAIDRIMSEGALYSQQLARQAIDEAGGDLLEAAFYLRAHRSTCRRAGVADPIETGDIRCMRRISATFKDIVGGQVLGPSSDYLVKLFSREQPDGEYCPPGSAQTPVQRLPSALGELRKQGMIMVPEVYEESPFDITRYSPQSPYPRSALMQMMARGETGAMLAFAYTSMRGYGDVHPTIGDLRLGMAEVTCTHPFTGNRVRVGEIRVTAVETVGAFKKDPADGKLRLATGFGFCFGFNETKAIAMSILDLALTYPGYSIGESGPAASSEMIMHHIDGVESMGFTNHFKLPHYVTFQADLQTYARAKKHHD